MFAIVITIQIKQTKITMKQIFMTVAAAFLAASAMAQVQIGPKVGMNLYKINGGEKVEEGTSEPFAIGFNLGVGASFSISDNFAIAPELIYTQKGGSAKQERGEDFIKYTRRNNYVEIPVLTRATFGNTVKGYVNAGPSVGYWVGGSLRSKVKVNGEVESESTKFKFVSKDDEIGSNEVPILKDRANRVELGAALGGGVMFDTSAGDVLLDIRYQAGLTSLVKPSDNDDVTIKNNGLSVSAIYLLDFR